MKEEINLFKKEERVHAHICGDGYTYITRQRYKNNYIKGYSIRYSNSCELLRNLFKEDLKNAYNRIGINCYSNNEIEIRAKWIFNRLRSLGALGSHLWFIPSTILNSNNKIIQNWLNAFFDDEATVEVPNPPKDYHRRITIKCCNKKGILQVSKLLQKININPTITANSDRTWYLRITGFENLKNFKEKVNFNHPIKKEKLSNLLKLFRI